MLGGCFNVDDASIASLFNGLRSIKAGITTVVDHSHLQKSPAVSDALARGMLDSGVGGFFCYALQNVTDSLDGNEVDEKSVRELLARPADDWHYDNAERIRKTFFDGKQGPLRFGVALYEAIAYIPEEHAQQLFERANSLRPALLTCHSNAIQKPGFYKQISSAYIRLAQLNHQRYSAITTSSAMTTFS